MDSTVPGANNLTEFLDRIQKTVSDEWRLLCEIERLLIVLRDGRKLYGILRSYDQFGNIVLADTIERIYVDLEYAEENLGVFLARGENIVLVGAMVRDWIRPAPLYE